MIKQIFFSLLLVGASLLAQAPSPLPQPSTPSYGFDQLALYPTYDRASFESKFGVQASAFDPSKPAKAWFDNTVTCVANLGTSFKVQSDSPSDVNFSTMLVPSCDVSKVNLPGVQHFTTFVPNSVSNVTIGVKGGPQSGVGALIQSTLGDALALVKEIGDNSLPISHNATAPGSVFAYQTIDATSPVGVYMVGKMNVEQALLTRNANGVGSPGTWIKQSAGIYVWTPAPPPATGTGAKFMKMPLRDLLPNEKVTLSAMTILGAFAQVTRTDLAGPVAPTGDGGFTSQDRSDLQSVLRMLKALTGQ